MADVLSFRLKQRPVRMAAAISTLAVCFFYLLAQMAGAGGLVALLLGIDDKAGQSLVIAVVGIIMIAYVLIGGMKGTTWVQIIKAVLLILGAGVMFLWVLGKFGLNLSSLLGDAVEASGGKKVLDPGLQYGKSGTTKLDFISLSLALVLGTAGLPHVLMRFYTVPSSKRGPEVGRVGHLADRHLLPVHPRARVRRRRPRRPQGHRGRTGQGQLGGATARLRARW